MAPGEFREIALSFPEVVESAHMSHPDFRVCGRIFATLDYPDEEWGMIKLTPEEQENFVRANPDVFRPVKGAWGRRGNTNVYLSAAKIDRVREALGIAWCHAAPKRLIRREQDR
jgi:hypothetical protein